MVIPFRGQGLSLRTTPLNCQDYIVGVPNEWTQINYCKFCFLSIRLSLIVEFIHINSLRYLAWQMRT